MAQERNHIKNRLRFGDDEGAETPPKKPRRKAQKAIEKFAKAESKAPMKHTPTIERATDAQIGKPVARLRFGEMPSRKPSGKLAASLPRTPGKLLHQLDTTDDRQNDDENNGDVGNVGVDAARGARGLGESALQTTHNRVQHAHKLRPNRQMERIGTRLERANARARQNAPGASNPLSRRWQRQSAKQGYAARKAQGAGARATEKVAERISRSFRKNKKSMVMFGLIFVMFAMVMNAISSCTPLVQSGFQAIIMTTYPAEDADLLAAERMYAQMEKDLQSMLDNYERDHDYHEYYSIFY